MLELDGINIKELSSPPEQVKPQETQDEPRRTKPKISLKNLFETENNNNNIVQTKSSIFFYSFKFYCFRYFREEQKMLDVDIEKLCTNILDMVSKQKVLDLGWI